MERGYWIAAIIPLSLLAIPSAAFALAQGKPEKERIRIGYAARAVVHSIPYVTNAAGFFREEGLQRPGDAYEKNARFALRHLGLDPDKDVKFLYLGSNEVMWLGLESRKVSATMLTPPSTLFARKAGMNFLVNLSDLKVEYQGSSLTTRRSFIKDNANLTLRVVRAIVRGIHFFKTRREDTFHILSKFFGTINREALEESWHYASDVPTKPYASESAVQVVINHLAERDARFAQHKPTEFIDSGPLSELDRSGFINRLYGTK